MANEQHQQILNQLRASAQLIIGNRQRDEHTVEKLVDEARALNMHPSEEEIVCSMLYAAEESFVMRGNIS